MAAHGSAGWTEGTGHPWRSHGSAFPFLRCKDVSVSAEHVFLGTAKGPEGDKNNSLFEWHLPPSGEASEMVRISIFTKINIFSRRFSSCFLETAEKELKKEREKEERRGRERKGGGRRVAGPAGY